MAKRTRGIMARIKDELLRNGLSVVYNFFESSHLLSHEATNTDERVGH